MAQVIWTDRALAHVDRIKGYLTAEAGQRTADRFVRRLIAAGDSLADNPERGRPAAKGARELVSVRPYLIRYRVDRDFVRIVGVRHGAWRPLA